MAEVSPCPTLGHYEDADQCMENYAGVDPTIYVGIIDDLAEKMTLTDNTYTTPKFKPGKGLFKIDCKDDANNIEGSNLGGTKGYKITGNFTIEAVNKILSRYDRALNNLKLFIIIPDGEEFQIMYDPKRKVKFDADGIKTVTGSAPTDDRITTLSCTIQPVPYPNLYVTITDIDTLLEGYTASA